MSHKRIEQWFNHKTMKTHNITVAICIGILSMAPLDLQAKPGKGNGNGKGGAPGHSDQGKSKKAKKSHPGKGKGKGNGNKADHNSGKGKKHDDWRFVDRDRDVILNYFSGHREAPQGLPPGLAKNVRRGKPLPPGWQKKLVAGQVVDGEWWDRLVPIQDGMISGLPAIDGTGLYYYGDRVFRVHRDRREVLDVVIVPTIHIGS